MKIEESDKFGRRSFVAKAGCACLGLSALSLLSACDSGAMDEEESQDGISISTGEVIVDLSMSPNDRLNTVGEFMLIKAASVFIINETGTIKALSSICNHNNCDVNNFVGGEIICPCHGSKFSTDGAILKTPATLPLQVKQVRIDGDSLTITR